MSTCPRVRKPPQGGSATAPPKNQPSAEALSIAQAEQVFDLVKVSVMDLFEKGEKPECAKPSKRIQPGRHVVRGTMLVALDAFVDKAGPGTCRMSFPTKDVLAYALQLALEDQPGQEDKLHSLLKKAARAVLRHDPDKKVLDPVHRTLRGIDEVQTELLEEIPQVPRNGNLKVTGRAVIMDWTPQGL